MGIEFAEKIIDSMVDGNGHCGERGLSEKQFDAIARYLDSEGSEWVNAWHGNYGGRVDFYSTDYVGTIGKYDVRLNEFWHFHRRCTVVEIDLRPQGEYERECWLRELGRFEHSEWQHEPKERIDLELTLVREYSYERLAYGYSNRSETFHIYTLADADGNCYVWKSANWLEQEVVDENGRCDYISADPGDKVFMKATVKEHSEWKGIRQTVITRPKISRVEKAA